MKSRMLQALAIVIILEIGLVHYFTAQHEFEEAAVLGFLFIANFLGAIVAAYAIYRQKTWGWGLGLAIAVGSIAGYAWSRTLGMPGMDVEEWFTPYGIVAMMLEGAFIILVLFRPWKIPNGELQPSTSGRLRYILPVAGLLVMISISALSYQWDAAVTQAYGYHVGSLEHVMDTPVTASVDLEKQYGVQVSLVATSMMDSIVDVRLKIIDPDKAHVFLQNQAALLVDQQALILAPHMHSHSSTRLKAGKVFIVFFPTQKIIHPGSEVSLVFGSVRLEPVIVQ